MAITTKKYLDFEGLGYFWGKAKTYIDGKFSEVSDSITGEGGLESRIKSVEDGLDVITKDAPEAFDTLKEVAAWIESHGENQATEIIGDLNKIKAAFPLNSSLTYEGAYTGKTTVKDDVAAAKSAIETLALDVDNNIGSIPKSGAGNTIDSLFPAES